MTLFKRRQTALFIGCVALAMCGAAKIACCADSPQKTVAAKSHDEPNPAYDIDPVEASLNQHYNQPLRPQYHYTALQGHLGDATGLIYYQGEYHLFYMFDKWERRRNRHKCWGHAVSRDCIHWEELPPVLDTLIDHKPGSGSGLVDWNNSLGLGTGPHKTLVIFYTDYGTGSCLAYSNDAGRTWVRHPRNPVIAGTEDARDPTVFWYAPAGRWRMVRYEKQGFVFYGSANLVDWTQLSRIAGFYECPDLIELPVEGSPGQRKWVLIAADCSYVLGSFDGREFKPETEALKVECGKTVYAPQIWKRTPEGGSPAIQMGFLRYPSQPRLTWHNQMSIPCELKLRTFPDGVRLCRLPINEIDYLRIGQQVWRELTVKPGQNPLSEIQGDLFDIRAEIELAGASEFVIAARSQTVGYSVKTEEFSLGSTKAPLKPTAKRVRFQLLVDRSSIELFADQGQATISQVVLPDPSDLGLSLTAKGGDIRVVSLEVNRLGSIWLENEARLGRPRARAFLDK